MALSASKRVILAKIETSYGVDAEPVGANAILTKNLTVTPLDSELVDRNLLKPYFGNSEKILATSFLRMDFEVEAAGAGAAGQVPAYDQLLRACALAKTINEASISIEIDTGVAIVAHVGHGYVGTGNKVTISGATLTSLNGIKSITVTGPDSYTFLTEEADDEEAEGAIKCLTGVEYKPVSANIESVTIDYNLDGVLHKGLGGRGSVELVIEAKQIPVFRFSFTLLFVNPADIAAPTADFSGFKYPQIANTQNTPGFELFEYTGVLQSINFNLANDVQYITQIGAEAVRILNRLPTGTILCEAPTIAEKDFFTLAKETTPGEVSIEHGRRAGEKVKVIAPKVTLGNPTYQELNNIMMLSIPYIPNPDEGNDELSILIA